MTTTQSLPSHALSIDVDEDKMEMATSPYPGPHNDDDDIDFELDDQRDHSIEDNSMIDDNTETMDTNLEQNDMMFFEEDNELIDFDHDLHMDPDQSSYVNEPNVNQKEKDNLAQPVSHDQSIQDASFEDATIAEHDTNSREDEMEEHDVQEEATNIDLNVFEDSVPNGTIQEPETQLSTDAADEPIDTTAQDESPLETQISDVKDFAPDNVTAEISEQARTQSSDEETATHEEPSIESAEAVEEDEQTQQRIEALAAELDQSTEQAEDGAEASRNEQAHQSPQREATPVALHPVTIRYNGEDCWLFPPFENTEARHVFLEDVALASQPFDRLLAALRSGLVNDQEMADHDELVFDIPVLGLHICEDSKHASLMNLSRVIDIYMMLSQNEGLTVFEPLYCELSTRVCLADQFAYVDDAAFVRRITYTDFVAEQAGSPEEPSEDLNEEDPEAEISVAEGKEQTHVDTSTYYDAANEAEDEPEAEAEEEPTNNLNDIQENDQNLDVTEAIHPIQLAQSETGPDALEDDTVNEEEAYMGNIQASAHSSPKVESNVAAGASKVENAQQNSPGPMSHDDGLLTATQPKEKSTEEFDETTVQIEADADEDLFADDDIESNDQEVGPNTFKVVKADDDKDGVEPQSLTINDDFDFDNWSDDEHDTSKNEASSNHLATPSKGVNGKRKLVDEEEDFLDLDIATPEPKRSRQT